MPLPLLCTARLRNPEKLLSGYYLLFVSVVYRLVSRLNALQAILRDNVDKTDPQGGAQSAEHVLRIDIFVQSWF